jgi:hypothetical protein
VSFEAIKCLLSLKDSYAVERLMGYLRSGTLAEREQAITLLGVHTVEEAVPELILILKKKKENRLTLPQEITIVQALGNIGDARSLNTFRKILFRRKFVFFAGAKENLKMEIYRTMKNFPYGDIEDILREGLKSRNEYIKNESLRLIKIRKQ